MQRRDNIAKPKKEYHYYVLVFTDHGPVYVTELGDHHTAYWNCMEKPYELSKEWADDVCLGLNMNFYTSAVVKMPFEIESQPYRYDEYRLEFKEREEDDDDYDDE